MFYDIVRKLPDGAQIVLEGDGDRSVLAIRAGRSRFTLQTLPESDFPDLAAGEMTHNFTLAASDVKRLIDRTQFAISTEETAIISTASICMRRAAPRPPPCARSQPTGIDWRRSMCPCRRAAMACRA